MTVQSTLSLLSLNANCGRSDDFFTEFSVLTRDLPDIVCLQEVLDCTVGSVMYRSKSGAQRRMLSLLRKRYDEYYEFFYSPRISTWPAGGIYSPKDQDDIAHGWGNLIMVRRTKAYIWDLRSPFIFHAHDEWDHQDLSSMPVNLQMVLLKLRTKPEKYLLVANIHGWYGGNGFGKGDCLVRHTQSYNIVNHIRGMAGNSVPVILAGDLNLDIDTDALRILEKELNGTNCIKQFNISTTRTNLYSKRLHMPHADYVITGPAITQKSCVVPIEMPISDHAPIVLEFSL